MRQSNNSIQFLAGNYVSTMMTKQLSHDLLFHNLHHTINVVKGVREISRQLKLNSSENEILLLAAWFHDSGHVITYKGHEIESQKLAKVFLQNENYPQEKIEEVLACIGATKMPQEPQNLLQEVICDADLYHLSLPEYPHEQHLLREEWSRVFKKRYADDEWNKENFKFLNDHEYFTSYGKSVLRKRKLVNVENWKHQMINEVSIPRKSNWRKLNSTIFSKITLHIQNSKNKKICPNTSI